MFFCTLLLPINEEFYEDYKNTYLIILASSLLGKTYWNKTCESRPHVVQLCQQRLGPTGLGSGPHCCPRREQV